MLRFTHDDADVLVTTTLIENGLEHPSRQHDSSSTAPIGLGLAQLYQLRDASPKRARMRTPTS